MVAPASYIRLLQECCHSKALQEGKRIHEVMKRAGLEGGREIGNLLVSLYGKCGEVEAARRAFDNIRVMDRNVVSWTAMVSAYALNGCSQAALDLFHQMQRHGRIPPNKVTFLSILKACRSRETLEQGKLIHALIVNCGLGSDLVIGNALINMYCKCSSVDDACGVFENMSSKDVVSWTSMISAYVQNGNEKAALCTLRHMQEEGVKPNSVTFLTILDAFSSRDSLSNGKLIHALISENGFESDVVVSTGLLDMYGKCGSFRDAYAFFQKMTRKNVITWSVMIGISTQYGHGALALQLFRQMQWEGTLPDRLAFLSILEACTNLAYLEEGKLMHYEILNRRFDMDVVLGTSLLNMYANCGDLNEAWKIFISMPERNVISWSAMVAAYARNGQAPRALHLFEQMWQQGVKPTKFTFVSALDACASLALLEEGQEIHSRVALCKLEADVSVANALVHMYSKCGSLDYALLMFDRMVDRDPVSWNTIIGAYAEYGNGKLALQVCGQMQWEKVRTDGVGFVSVLTACSHMGLVTEGFHYFDSIAAIGDFEPTAQHYACVIDILGRAGKLVEVSNFIDNMPFQDDPIIWRTLLGACRVHGDVSRAKYAAKHLNELNALHPALKSCC